MKGNVLISQSGGPTAVINSSCSGIVQEVLKHQDKFNRVYGAVNGILGVLNEELADLSKEDDLTIELLRQTPSSALGSCRYKLSEKDYDRVLQVIEAHNIRYCFFIGGNDTMDTANKVDKLLKERKWEAYVNGIPKTVDNDLMETDHCPGYASAAKWLAIATRDAGLDTKAIYTSDTIKIIETMGRDSGWMAAATALARDDDSDPPHLIYLPERPLDPQKFLMDVKKVHSKLGYAVIAVSEGLRGEDGKVLVESKSKIDLDAFGHGQRGGVADYLCHLISDNLKLKARFDKPGTIQRVSMVCASEVDLKEAYEVGRKAVKEAIAGKSGNMITLLRVKGDMYRSRTGTVALNKVANRAKPVPDKFINKAGNNVTKEFLDWLKPLLGSPLIEYAHLKRALVKKKLEPFNTKK